MTDYLIVDDEFPIREWVVFVIKKHFPDIHVDSADNGLTALSMLHKKHYDFLITDIRMPKLNGMELLQKLHDVSPSTKIVVLSSYSDYNYVRHAFKHYALDYLLKAEITEDHLVQIIRQQQRLILNQENTRNVTRIVSDHIMNPALSLESFELQLKNNGVELPLSDFFLYFIKSDGVTFEYGSAKIPSGKYAEPVLSIPVSPNCQLGIIHLTQISRRVQFQDRNTFFTELAQYNSHSLILSSDICRNKADILRFLRIMYIHRDLDFYGIRKHLITEESFLWESAFNLAYGNLLRTIQFRDPENFSDTLQQFFAQILSIYVPDIHRLKDTLKKILEFHLINNNIRLGSNGHESLLDVCKQIDSANSFQQLQEYALGYAQKSFSLPGQHLSSSNISQCILYIEKNYMSDIGLNDLANYVHLNPEYLSRQFKKQTGSNFSTYLTNFRLQKAALMIRQSNEKISEISRNVGFNNFSYFSKCFRQLYGCSPIEWRNQ